MKKLNLCAILFLSFSAVYAQDPVKVAVMDLKARSGIDNMTVSSLTDFVCTTILDVGEYDVIGKDDMKTMMEHIADRQLLDCDDTRCLAKIGGALGVQLLVSGNIGMVGKMYLINIKLIDIDEATVRNRVSEKYLGDETGLVTKVEQSIHKLFGDAAAEVALEPEPEPEPEPVTVEPSPAPAAPPAPHAAPETDADDDGKKRIRFGLLAGVNLGLVDYGDAAFYDYNYSDYEDEMLPGMYLGTRLTVPVTAPFAVQLEAAFSQKNFFLYTQISDFSMAAQYRQSVDYSLNYLDLQAAPVLQAGPVQLSAGLRFSLLLGAHVSGEVEVVDMGTGAVVNRADVDDDVSEFFSGADLGIVLGGGVLAGHFSGDVRFDVGLTNINAEPMTDDMGNEEYNSTIAVQLLLGYSF